MFSSADAAFVAAPPPCPPVQDEVLSHRLGLIPLKVDPRLFQYKVGGGWKSLQSGNAAICAKVLQ